MKWNVVFYSSCRLFENRKDCFENRYQNGSFICFFARNDQREAMKETESLEDFYQRKFNWLPENFELLERQFPIDDNHPEVHLRSASDFAHQLNVHVNHLNRALKEMTGKTTSRIIAERIAQEAKVLLKHSN